MKSAEERILDLLNEKAPMTIRKIAEETSMSHSTCARVLAKLCEEDKIVKIQGSSSGRAYYLMNREATVADVSNMHIEIAKDTIDAVFLSIDIFETEDYSKLDEIELLESNVDNYEKELIHNHVERLMNSNCDALSGIIFSDIVTDLERCSDHAINLAYALKERNN